MFSLFEATGQKLVSMIGSAGHVLILIGQTALMMRRFFTRWRETVVQMYLIGVQSMPVTMIFALFSGMIIALETGVEIDKFSQVTRLGSVVAAAMCKEWGPMMTAIILTARAGSAMAAELSVMKVSDEIDALEVMSVNPIRYLVMPRVVATILICVAMSILSSYVGTMGGYLVYKFRFSYDVSPQAPTGALSISTHSPSYQQYFTAAEESLETSDITSGLLKSAVFGLVIASIACTRGLLASRGATGVGVAVRDTVVSSLMVIIVLNYAISNLFVGGRLL